MHEHTHCTDTTDPKAEIYLRKSISLLEALKDETMLEDLELYYYKLGTVLISQGGGGLYLSCEIVQRLRNY